ncbi:MAG TPA: ABC transporter ATP-binding protein [Bryobacteraceae bacterium]|nr:ABC transporter ATP-binding protein [Bryobacteraceae bacterium]
MTNAVNARSVSKWFGEGETRVQALTSLDLEIRMGELSILMGPSGCGKTTLVSVIAGLLDASEGELDVLGERPAEMCPNEQILFRRRNVGFVFQQFNLLPALTAAENAAVPLFVAGQRQRESVARAEALLAELGMAERAHALPNQLSGGQQQRVAIARALIHDPRLVVCDEPTSALDAESGHAVMELLTRIAVRDDRAVIVVTHDNRVLEFADTVAHMEDGQIVEIERKRPS